MQKSVICYTVFEPQRREKQGSSKSFDTIAGAECIEAAVRKTFIQAGSIVILILCLWGHVSELFDHWDHTPQTGNDTEYSTVIAVLAAGAVILFARSLTVWLRGTRATASLKPAAALCAPLRFIATQLIADSPPCPLRI